MAEPLGLSIEDAAWGIHQIVNESMAGAARVHTLERGGDPRRLPVFAFGGAGPVHAYRVAAALGSPRLIVPAGAGVMSAIGFLAAPVAFDFTRSFPGRLDTLDWERVNALLAEMEAGGARRCSRPPVSASRRSRTGAPPRCATSGRGMRCECRCRTGHSDRGVFRPCERLSRPSTAVSTAAWDHRCRWRRSPGAPSPPGREPDLRLANAAPATGDVATAAKGARLAYLPEEGGMMEVTVYDRYRLGPGSAFLGPAIIEERESTTVIGPGAAVTVDTEGNLVVEVKEPHVR